MPTMRFGKCLTDETLTIATFEVDPEIKFSEQYIASAALGAFALREPRDPKTQAIVSFLGIKIRQLAPTKQEEVCAPIAGEQEPPKPVEMDLSPQEADTLWQALLYSTYLTRENLDYFACTHNYQAASTRIQEDEMAKIMIGQLQERFKLKPEKLTERPLVGFAAALLKT